jgi:hypothetical protein
MSLAYAIAQSPGNKAKAYSSTTGFIYVQERYTGIGETWLHVWIVKPLDRIDHVEVTETDIPLPHIMVLYDVYGVDPDADCWSPV